MGIGFAYIQKMDELELFRQDRMAILDIGSSNLYSATPEGIKGFLRKYRPPSASGIDEFAARLAAGSSYDPVTGGRNESFVGELFEKAGMQYESIDIAAGFRTTILDLNRAVLPAALQRRFDLVLNFGTTEHILNQLNCFKVIHDATKVGGHIYHSLPAVGYVDHGYITYTGRCFFDVAGYNEYELVACWFDGPSGGSCVLDSLQSYSGYFPVLKAALEQFAATEQGRALRELRVPDIGINVVYRKLKDKPFRGALESSTSVGAISGGVTAAYQGGTEAGAQSRYASTGNFKPSVNASAAAPFARRVAAALRGQPLLYDIARRAYRAVTGISSNRLERWEKATVNDPTDEKERALSNRLLAGKATLDEGLRLYAMMTARGAAFPLAWEELVLSLGLAAQPDRLDLQARLRHVLAAQGKPVTADIEQAFAEHATREERTRDHQRDAAEYHAKSGTADMDEQFLPIYERCRGYSMTSVERMYALFKAIKYLEGAGIDGDIVECGVWRGGSMMVAAQTLVALESTGRNLYLFDTYEGLPRPEEDKDVDLWGNRAIDGWLPRSLGEEKSHWANAGEEEVRANLISTGYPAARLHLVKGMVERTIPHAAPQRIALLRLDTDWYASTKHELEHLFQRLSHHGVLIIDDYGHFKGARAAVDEFLQSRSIPLLLHRVDYSGRVGIKIAD